jgi:hypothetical protein
LGETRVDLLHLLEDLADAYPGDLHETVLTEIVANALDSGASHLAIQADAAARTLTVTDDGSGMTRADLRRFHDVAMSTKERGEGIGFAGVGIKLGLLVSEEVLTESRRGASHISTSWSLVSRKRAPWRWITPLDLAGERGTAVRLRLSDVLSPLLDAGFLEAALRRHFEPLFDPAFDEILHAHYPHGVAFSIGGATLERQPLADDVRSPLVLRLARKRKPAGAGWIAREPVNLPDDRRGLAISTYGKVIKRGWDWLGINPAAAERTTGMIETPALAAALTLNKTDFIRSGPRGALYLAYRKAIQEAVAQQLAQWGDEESADTAAHRRVARPIERDMEEVLADLADDFPLLAMLVERRAGGRKRFPSGNGTSAARDTLDMFAPPREMEAPTTEAPSQEPAAMSVHEAPPREQPAEGDVSSTGRRGPARPARLGLTIQFESRPDDSELGRLVESTVWVNDAHPAYRRAAASRSEGYHIALAVAMALASVATDPLHEHEFVLEFLSRWGETRAPRRRRPKGRAKRSG